jgi:laminin alpha 3/5
MEEIHFLFFRDKLVNLQPSTGYRFDGNGYAIVSSRPYRMRERSDVQLKFKTTARDGLLFLAGKGQTFLSVELREGNVVYQVWLSI